MSEANVARTDLEEMAAMAPLFLEDGINRAADVLAVSSAAEELRRIATDPEFRLIGHSGISIRKVLARAKALEEKLGVPS